MTLLYYDPLFLEHQTGKHPERPERLIQVMRQLSRIGLDARCQQPAWVAATTEKLALVHDPGYTAQIEAYCQSGGGRIEEDTVCSPRSFDAARLAALAGSSHRPLAELVAKIRREERYHLMHVEAWLERLADAGGEPRERLLAALATMGPDAGTVLAPLPGEEALVRHGIVGEPAAAIEAAWRAGVAATFRRLGLPELPPTRDPLAARSGHTDAFRALHAEFPELTFDATIKIVPI